MRFPADAEFLLPDEVMNQLKRISNETAQRKAQVSPLGMMALSALELTYVLFYAEIIIFIQECCRNPPGENPELLQRLVAIHREGPTIVGSGKVCSTVPAEASEKVEMLKRRQKKAATQMVI